MNRISAATLLDWIMDGHELALLDAREDGEFGASHLFWAVPCGLARKEIRARALLPRLATRICCVDDGRGLSDAERAQVSRRGQRLDESKPGSGLGLSIVIDLAALYGGSLTLGRAPIGGLRAELVLPGV